MLFVDESFRIFMDEHKTMPWEFKEGTSGLERYIEVVKAHIKMFNNEIACEAILSHDFNLLASD